MDQEGAIILKIRDSFLKAFVGIFKGYRNFIDESKYGDPNFEHYFNKTKFLDSFNKDYKPFVSQFIQTQILQRFLDRKANPQKSEDMLQCRFFDEQIIFKSNRSLMASPQVLTLLSLFSPLHS